MLVRLLIPLLSIIIIAVIVAAIKIIKANRTYSKYVDYSIDNMIAIVDDTDESNKCFRIGYRVKNSENEAYFPFYDEVRTYIKSGNNYYFK